MTRCIVNGCQNEASNNFGVRLRREDTTAIWAPNTEAFICDEHASSGFRIDVQLTPMNTDEIQTSVSSNNGRPVNRRTNINHRP